MATKTKKKVFCNLQIVSCNAKCPDFDEDCKDIENPTGCFIGGTIIDRVGNVVHTDTAKGYCPDEPALQLTMRLRIVADHEL